MQRAIDLKLLVCLYKHGSAESQEICEILLSNPKKTAGVALERMKGKLKEVEDAKFTQAKKQWHEVAEKNFHRSLDHRSFIFKRHDRKFTQAARFEKEPEFRSKLIIKASARQTAATTAAAAISGKGSLAQETIGKGGHKEIIEQGDNGLDFESDPT